MDKTQRRQEWEAQITDFKASGLTMSAWCSAHGLTIHQLKYWLRKINHQANFTPSNASSVHWLPLAAQNSVNPALSPALVVRIGQASVEIREGFDPVLLRQVVQALEMSC